MTFSIRVTFTSIAIAVACLGTQWAVASEDLAKKSACTACHAIDKKLVGPAYNDVAAKYAGRKDAVAYLVEKIKKGSMGVWGPVPMPANAALKDEDAKILATWVLSLKPAAKK